MSSTTAGSGRPLHGKSALISGASRGIGLECARSLHAAGARLFLLGRDGAALAALAESLDTGHDISLHRVDLTKRDMIASTLTDIRNALGGAPDIIVNNAGHFFLARADETSLDDFERTLQVNLASPFAIVRAFLADMKTRKRGHIVTIGSIADHLAFPENAAYAASKFGVRGLHEVLREELRGSGIRTTLISPGPVDTALWDAIRPDEREGFSKRGSMLSPAGVADAVRYAVTCPDEVNVDELRLSRS